ncbi:hypothetical protein GCM10027174_42530 [Salinifilum aidingensis]
MTAPERPSADEEHIRATAGAVLRAHLAGDGADPFDPAPAALARLLADGGGDDEHRLALSALRAWSTAPRRAQPHLGLSGGAGGLLVGVRTGRHLDERLGALEAKLLAAIHRSMPAQLARARRGERGFGDYDLIIGPAGTLLAALVDRSGAEPHADATVDDLVALLAAHLAELCDTADLDGLRVSAYAGHELLDWMQGRVNTGIGHGVPGVLLALAAAVRHLGDAELHPPLRRAAQWLMARAFTDEHGSTCWYGGQLFDGEEPPPGPMRRQAWCYGTPGVAWALWEAGAALGDGRIQRFAADAFDSVARRYDPDWHLFGGGAEETLTLCHGAAGVLGLADCFHRHAGSTSAGVLREDLRRYITDRADQLAALAGTDRALLNGACGAAAALLSCSGADRSWMLCLGLR